MKKINSRKGFTLIEMLIVIAIIGILASIVLVGLGPIQRRGRDARRQADLGQVRNALELYYYKCGHYPGGSACTDPVGNPTWDALEQAVRGASIGISQIPNDPSEGQSYTYATNGSGYVLMAVLEDANNPALNDREAPGNGVTDPGCTEGTNYCLEL
ncbi:MAG: hypothetical protein A2855_00345 [Candidatus Liptonbacteria bacterium RIFCSPHIGHO2_01_FULL_57_28]|uniref:Type II secretion system protein GspG C-terminal domain-containing protein n=1 Tax=Candidatus Liptonbacteria bacterium RIFCSPHIGHO2_01_FULL_57_28 TaxID=1798647 RepID=A0A1G2C930_9BACT|nr:MAG: hypothetical protein A2855_00345 [Candidatus Liptonbacteria bacterium RIFCSPHIGHO2_01_FULL_57_28]